MKERKPTTWRGIFILSAILYSVQLWAQPYVDPLQVRYMYAMRNSNTPATPFTHLWIGSDLPVRLKGDGLLLFSPYYEQWSIDSAETSEMYPPLQSVVLPVGLIMPIKESKWTFSIIPIVRSNGEKLFAENTFQYGGVTLVGFARKPQQKFRLGVYANAEFFGLFIVPLIGCDWRIDDKNYLFGVLPGRLTFEHQWNEKLFGGVTFRAPTHSYRLANGQYVRLDDNQLSVFVDYYPVKHICVTIESGIGVLRKIRTGIDDRDYITSVNWGDGPFIKLSAAYRIRL